MGQEARDLHGNEISAHTGKQSSIRDRQQECRVHALWQEALALPTCCVLTVPKYRAEKDRKCYPSVGNKPLGRCTDEAPAVFQKNTELPADLMLLCNSR